MGERHLVMEVVLPIHDGDDLLAMLEDNGPSTTLQIADIIGMIDNRITIVYLAHHDDDDDGAGAHMHAEPGRVIKMRLDDEQWLDFTAGRELGGEGE